MTELLQTDGLTRGYGALTAVDGVDFTLGFGARHALIGPNGAGKTTLLNLIAGSIRPTSGRIRFNGTDITRATSARRCMLGIGRSFQQPAVVPGLSVLDNLVLAAWRHAHARATWGSRRLGRLTDQCRQRLGEFGLAPFADHPAGRLSHGQRRLLDIAAAMSGCPRLLLLDEPAAGLTDEDVAHLVALFGQLPAEVATLLVEHNLDVVTALASAVTVLHAGRVLRTGSPAQIQKDPEVRRAYFGSVEPVSQTC
ncbi:ABC transporter ATP-binding protein [Actinocrispum wychmicini]|nr:ABC transporter ATP-binding protein [Actinocrispum wychmicini]